MQNRATRAQARRDSRDWVQERRARTRQLIELGGLLQKAGLGDRTLQQFAAAWRHRGLRAFEADRDADAA